MPSLRWYMPAGSAPADTFCPHRDGFPLGCPLELEPDAAGIYYFILPEWPQAAGYAVVASNAAGDSPPSNVIFLPEPTLWIGLGLCVVALLLLTQARKR